MLSFGEFSFGPGMIILLEFREFSFWQLTITCFLCVFIRTRLSRSTRSVLSLLEHLLLVWVQLDSSLSGHIFPIRIFSNEQLQKKGNQTSFTGGITGCTPGTTIGDEASCVGGYVRQYQFINLSGSPQSLDHQTGTYDPGGGSCYGAKKCFCATYSENLRM